MNRTTTTSLGVIAIAAIALSAAPKEKLEFKFAEGQELTYSTKIDAGMEFMGQEMDTSSDYDETFKVLQVKDGKARVSDTISNFKASGSEDSIPNSMEGLSTEYSVDSKGKMSDYKVNDFGEINEMAKSQIENSTMQLASGFMGLFLPEEPVAEGDTWKRTRQMSASGGKDSELEYTYTFKGFETVKGNRLAVIESRAEDVYMLEIESPSGTIDLEIDTKQTSKFYFDVRRGVVTKVVSTNDSLVDSGMGEMVQTSETTTVLK